MKKKRLPKEFYIKFLYQILYTQLQPQTTIAIFQKKPPSLIITDGGRWRACGIPKLEA
jgi:hypothetical protein